MQKGCEVRKASAIERIVSYLKFTCWSPNLMGIWSWGSLGGLEEVVRMEHSWWDLFPCEKRDTQELASSLSTCTPPKGHVNTQQGVAICNPRRKPSPDTGPIGIVILAFPLTSTMRSKFLVYGILLWHPKLPKTETKPSPRCVTWQMRLRQRLGNSSCCWGWHMKIHRDTCALQQC